MQEASPVSMGHKQLQNSLESNNFTETQDTELKQEGGGTKKKKKKKDVYHIAVVIYILEILPGLLRWTETVTDALAVAEPDAASEVPQQPAVPATTTHMSPHITTYNHQGSSQPRDAAASWARSSAQGPSASSKESAPRQRFGHWLPAARRWDTQEGPSEEGRCGKGKVLLAGDGLGLGLHSRSALGTDPASHRRERQSIVPGPVGSKERRKSRNRQQDVVESPKHH